MPITFRRGTWYSFSVGTPEYSAPETPLDLNDAAGTIQVEWATAYGQSAEKTRVGFLALRDFSSPALWWWGSDWIEHLHQPPAPSSTIPADQRGESWAVEAGDRFLSAVDETADQAMETVQGIGTTLKTIAGVALFGGVALIALQLLGRRR